jgi:hypothetical protein
VVSRLKQPHPGYRVRPLSSLDVFLFAKMY